MKFKGGNGMRKCIFAMALIVLCTGILFSPRALFAESKAVNIVLDSKHFTPLDHPYGATEYSIPLTWKGCKADDVMSRLNKARPDAITALPAFGVLNNITAT